MDESKQTFDASTYLTKIGGADYLEVKWRLLWLRTEHPDADIDTVLLSDVNDRATFKCTITIPGRGSATGHGSESAGDFRDYLEKGETKAIGRALAALGFGTQFSRDHEFGANQGRVVDSPVQRGGQQRGQQRGVSDRRDTAVRSGVATAAPGQPATQRQLGYLSAVGREAGFDADALNRISMREFQVMTASLTRGDCSTLIDLIQTGQVFDVDDGDEVAPNGSKPNQEQLNGFWSLSREKGLTPEAVNEAAMALFERPVPQLTAGELDEIEQQMRESKTLGVMAAVPFIGP